VPLIVSRPHGTLWTRDCRHDGHIFKAMEDGPTPNGQASAKPGMLGDDGALSLNVKPSGVNFGHLFGKCEVVGATLAVALEAGG